MPSKENYHVAFFTNTYLPFVAGVALSVDLFQRYLRALGDRVVVYAPEYDRPAQNEDGVQRLPSIRQFLHSDFSVPLPLAGGTFMDFGKELFDVVHVHHPFLLGEMGLRLARQHRLPLVFTYHTLYEEYTHYVPLNERMARKTIIRHCIDFAELCDLVIAPTRDIRRMLRERGVQTPIEVLPTGVERKQFARADAAAARRRLAIPLDAPMLVYVGRLAPEKNLDYLVSACLDVLEEVPHAHLVVAGDGQHRDHLPELAEARGYGGERVHFTGKVVGKNLVDLYAAGTLFVFASKTETQGMVVLEALTAGTPVVALDANGVRDFVEDGINGRLVPGDADESVFAQTVLDALKDPERLRNWSLAARETTAKYDMPEIAKRLHRLYRSLKTRPNHRLKRESMSFGLVRNYFETVWEELSQYFSPV
jgi:1,2-diacylglycerol 3-alpha-glucosyltransferase